MKRKLTYKGYCTTVVFDEEDNSYYVKLDGIQDLVNFMCDNEQKIMTEFQNAVDDYIEFCK